MVLEGPFIAAHMRANALERLTKGSLSVAAAVPAVTYHIAGLTSPRRTAYQSRPLPQGFAEPARSNPGVASPHELESKNDYSR